MTSVAINNTADELQFIEVADAEGEYACVECRAPCEYVRSHTRDLSSGGTTRVKAYFRLKNCTCGSGTPGSSNGGGGGGGGGETPLHKRRKAEAMNEATDRFDIDFFDTELYIGDKRGDAVVQFADGHKDYGKGLVIEYQHKNEGKDIEATEQHFAQHEYTTVWLWEDQFTFGGNLPEIDLFGGRVYTPWPDAVPPETEWWQPSDVPKQTLRALIGDLPNTEKPKPTLPGDIIYSTEQAYWRNTAWDQRFDPDTVSSYIEQVRTEFDLPAAEIPVTLTNDILAQIKRQKHETGDDELVDRPSNPFDDVQCWLCGCYWYADNGEEHTQCPLCGEPVDFDWNVQTSRISEKPSYA